MAASPARRPLVFALTLIVTGIVGLWSSFALTIDKILVLTDPAADLDCNFSVLVQCGVNLQSWQGSVFGFPNPIIGLVGFTAVIVVGASLLAGARFASWYWVLFNVGVLGAYVFVCWLQYQSIFNLGTLCPWCMTTWAATIPLFWAVTLWNAREGHLGRALRPAGRALYGWVPLITVLNYVLIAVVAQVRLDVLGYLF